MNFLSVFSKGSKWFYVYLTIFSMINSAMISTILLFINKKLVGDSWLFLNGYDWVLFAGVLVVSFVCSYKFEVYMVKLAEKIGIQLQTLIFQHLRYANYEQYLLLREEKVRTAFFDVKVLKNIPHNAIIMLNSAILIVVGLGYLLYTDFWAAIVVMLCIGIASVYYLFRLKVIKKNKVVIRGLDDEYQRILNDFLRGYRELKMSIKKNDNIISKFLLRLISDRVDLTVNYMTELLRNQMISKYVVYIVIGVLLFALPVLYSFDTEKMVVFVTTTLFISGSMFNLTNRIEVVISISISLKRLKQFQNTLKADIPAVEREVAIKPIEETFNRIRLKNLSFEYSNTNRTSAFKLNKINITINRGEIVFITGGNGSGKTTFINLLAGLFVAQEGELYYNNLRITGENMISYRDKISSVFTDNYLFSENYDEFELNKDNEEFHNLVKFMGLGEVIEIDHEKNRISSRLSKGQRKRLALIYAILENKEVLIFDEWAAEQDPEFRKYFYRVIIPKLKREGKTIIAITHDDAYFDCADRILKFEFGKITKDEQLVKETIPG